LELIIIKTQASWAITINSYDKRAADSCADALFGLIAERRGSYEHIIFLCIGTDRATGDAFGPLAGHMLIKGRNARRAYVYGSLHKPVHAANLTMALEAIYEHHKNPLIIAIDACLGAADKIGKIIIKDGAIIPGMAKGERLAKVGDISILGVVNIANGDTACPLEVLSSTRLNVVMQMAEVAAKAIGKCVGRLNTS